MKTTKIEKEINKLPVINLPKKKKLIGKGSFGDVYRISSRRVVKVYKEELIDGLYCAKDEKIGAKLFENGLPVLKIVRVTHKDKEYIGVIKRYLPNEATHYDRLPNTGYDATDWGPDQYRKDSKGKPYRVDTQTRKILSDDWS